MAQVRVRINPRAQDELDTLVDDWMETSVLPAMVNKAKRLAPIDTGELEGSIHYTSENHKYYIGADADHAAHVELGTSKMSAQPYLRPAVSSTKF